MVLPRVAALESFVDVPVMQQEERSVHSPHSDITGALTKVPKPQSLSALIGNLHEFEAKYEGHKLKLDHLHAEHEMSINNKNRRLLSACR